MTLNWVNEKVYIGQYSGKNPNYLGSGVYLRNAIKKHGKENFTRMTLEKGIVSQELLNQLEMYWVEFCDSTNKNKGYNLTDGGCGTSGFSNTHTPEWIAKMSIIMKDKAMQGLQTGVNNHNYGKQHTQESIDKMKIQWQKRTRVKGTFTQTQESNDKRSKALKGKKYINGISYKCEQKIENPLFIFFGHGNRGKHHTQETKDKRSKSVKAYYEIPENRAKLSKKRQTRI